MVFFEIFIMQCCVDFHRTPRVAVALVLMACQKSSAKITLCLSASFLGPFFGLAPIIWWKFHPRWCCVVFWTNPANYKLFSVVILQDLISERKKGKKRDCVRQIILFRSRRMLSARVSKSGCSLELSLVMILLSIGRKV